MGFFKKMFGGSSSDDDFVNRVRKDVFRKMAEAEKQALGDTPDTSLLYDVVLIDGHQRIYKASRIIEKYKGIRYTEASAMVDKAPCIVAERVAYDEAASLCEDFKQALAEVFIRRSIEDTDEATSDDVENKQKEESVPTPPPPPIPDTTAESKKVVASSENAVQTEEPTVAAEAKEELVVPHKVPEMQAESLQTVEEPTTSKQDSTPHDDESQVEESQVNAKVAEDTQENKTSEVKEKILERGMIGSSDDECITIPEGFTEIGYGCFGQTYKYLKKISIPNTITSIGELAFYDCSSLEEIVIPDSVQRLGDKAFEHCTSLESITIPNSVTTIGKNAFYRCENLEEIALPDSITTIREEAFNNCKCLETVKMPANLEKIGKDIFDFTNLKEVDFSKCSKITKLNLNSFGNCGNFECIYMPPHLEKIKGESSAQIATIFLPPSFKKIPEGALTWPHKIYCYSENVDSASALVTCCKQLYLQPDYIETFITYLQAEGRNVEQIDGKKYKVDVSDVKYRHDYNPTIILPIPPEKLYFYDD